MSGWDDTTSRSSPPDVTEFSGRARATAAGSPAADRRSRPRVVSARRDRPLRAGPAAGSGAAGDHGRGRGDHAPGDRAPHAGRAARRGQRPVRRIGRRRGCADHRHDAHEPRARDRPRQPPRRGPARRHQRRPEECGRGGGPLLPTRSGELRVLLDRRQHRHQCRRPVLREVRRHARRGAQPRGGHGRWARHPHRRAQREGRRRLLADPPDRRLTGHARDRDRGHAAPASGAAAEADDAGLLPDDRVGRRGGGVA